MFTAIREATGQVPIENGITFYRILMRQTMDETWKDSIYCMSNEVEWTEYEVVWGVLAENEEQARRLVVDMQGRAMDRTAEVLGVDEGGNGYSDIPGIVWQGLRDHSLDDEDDSESEDDEDDDFDDDEDDDKFGSDADSDHDEP
jgi:hypothetical protein